MISIRKPAFFKLTNFHHLANLFLKKIYQIFPFFLIEKKILKKLPMFLHIVQASRQDVKRI
jgi:hypothetical protein